MKKLALLLVVALLAVGCASSQEDKVLASANAFHYYVARYDERCVPEGPVGCAATNVALKTWKAAMSEAKDGLNRGGAIPLQVARVKKLEKEVAKCLPK